MHSLACPTSIIPRDNEMHTSAHVCDTNSLSLSLSLTNKHHETVVRAWHNHKCARQCTTHKSTNHTHTHAHVCGTIKTVWHNYNCVAQLQLCGTGVARHKYAAQSQVCETMQHTQVHKPHTHTHTSVWHHEIITSVWHNHMCAKQSNTHKCTNRTHTQVCDAIKRRQMCQGKCNTHQHEIAP